MMLSSGSMEHKFAGVNEMIGVGAESDGDYASGEGIYLDFTIVM